jgi:integrase/recombinase XerC
MLPHRSHQSAITAALDATRGNVRKVQSLNRHVNFETLMIYDDNRGESQLQITELLDDLIREKNEFLVIAILEILSSLFN